MVRALQVDFSAQIAVSRKYRVPDITLTTAVSAMSGIALTVDM